MPKHVMLALLSDQPLPNIMAALQYEPQPTHIEFIVSADKGDTERYDNRYEAKYEQIRKTLRALGFTCDRMKPVHPYRMQNVIQRCQEVVAKHADADHIVFNITGGTKLMSLAANQAAAMYQPTIPVIYIESRDRQVIHLCDGTSTTEYFDESKFSIITVERYLQAYGHTIRTSMNFDRLSSTDITTATYLIQNVSNWRGLHKKLVELTNSHGASALRSLSITSFPTTQQHLLHYLRYYGYLESNGDRPEELLLSISSPAWHFLKGGWLEVYALNALKTSGYFDDVQGQVTLQKSDIELDVVLTKNAGLAICEAKMGAKLSITMSKLRALQEAMAGVYGKTFYLTAAEQVTSDMRTNARVYGVSRIITASELPDISSIIASAI